MFCTNCGKQVDDNVMFCTGCGAKINNTQENNTQEAGQVTGSNQGTESVNNNVKQPMDPKRMKNIGIGAGIILAFVVLVGILLSSGKKVNLNDYATIEIKGYDTIATAQMNFDYEKFAKDYGNKIKIKNSNKNNELAELFGALSLEYVLEECIDGELDKTDEITNGDKITYSWKCDAENFKKLTGYKLKYKDFSEKASGLEKIATFDAFADLEVTFTGVAPNGEAHLNNMGDDYYIYYTADKDSGLDNGDVVTVSIPNNQDNYIREYNAVPKEYERQYTVEGLGSYIHKADEIPQEMLDKMIKEGSDWIQASATSWNEDCHLDGFQYIGNYFLDAKKGASVIENNEIMLLFKVQFTINSDDVHDTNQYYTMISYSDLMVLPDGTVSIELSNYQKMSESAEFDYPDVGWWGANYYVTGYKDLDTAFSKCVTQYIDRFNYENNVTDVDMGLPVVENQQTDAEEVVTEEE